MSRPTVVTVLPMMQEHHPCPSQHESWRQDIHDRLQQPSSPSSLHRHHQQPLSPAAHLENSVHNKPHLNQPHQSYHNRGIKSSKSGSNRTTRSLRKSSTSSYSTSKTGQNHSSSSLLESKFFDLGYMIQKHAAIVLFIGFMALFTSSVFLKSATIETRVEKLWVEVDGRLEKELNYIKNTLGEEVGSTDQLVIQTPKDDNVNILHANALLHHLEVMKAATEVTVDLFDVTWRLKDVCLTPSFPSFEESHIERIIDALFPCAIISPLDCFWEGSKILGPDYPVHVPGISSLNLKWTNLNPESLIRSVKSMESFRPEVSSFPFAFFEEIMKRAGITTAYQEKPCLDPSDENCPETAANKGSKISPDIGAELTGGCYGFATEYMHWPEDLIVGGVKKNKTGHIVKASALMSVIQLMGEQAMFDYWAKDYKVHNIDWNMEKARQVLNAWQRKFAQVVSAVTATPSLTSSRGSNKEDVIEGSNHYSYSVFTPTLLQDIMNNFSFSSHIKIYTGFAMIACYVLFASYSSSSSKSCCFASLSGVCLMSLSIVSALGCCSLLRIPLNATTTQVTPFLALGLGVFLLFLILNTYKDVVCKSKNSDEVYYEAITGQVLSSVGPTVVLISASGIVSLISAAILPMPALRSFCLSFAVILAFVTGSLLLIFPSLLGLDLRRRRSHRRDLFCCLESNDNEEEDSFEENEYDSSKTSSSRRRNNKTSKKNFCVIHSDKSHVSSKNNASLNDSLCSCQAPEEVNDTDTESATCLTNSKEFNSKIKEDKNELSDGSESSKKNYPFPSLLFFVHTLLSRSLIKRPVQVVVVVFFAAICLFCLSGISSVKFGIDMSNIVPTASIEHRFLDTQQKYFSFYHMFAVTEGNFEYPTNQKLLYEYHHSFTRVSKIIKNDDGGLPSFWLTSFRDWLLTLQAAFDRDSELGYMSQEGWNKTHASDQGILAFKLLVQTGRNDYPIDKTLVNKVRLVDSNGIINPKAFYNYLSAWVSNDALAYYSSQALLRPEPREWIHVASDFELKIPKSQPLVFAQMPFFLNRMNSTEEIVSTVSEIREICNKFVDKGLPNFPTGIPFTYYEQYVRLYQYFAVAGIVATAVVFLLTALFLMNPWVSLMMTSLLVLMVAQVFGIMGLMEIRLSAVPAVILIICIGIGTGFMIPLVVTFLKTDGKNRSDRITKSMEQTSPAVIQGIICLSLSIGILFFSEFEFIVKYFFVVLIGFVAFAASYGLLLLPIFLATFGPAAEIPPTSSPVQDQTSNHSREEDEDEESPESSRRWMSRTERQKSSNSNRRGSLPSTHFSRKEHPRVQSDISLSTIPEERDSIVQSIYQSSHDRIFVEPEFVVETTTTTNPVVCQQQQPVIIESPLPTTPESPLSRDSPMSDNSSTTSSSMSRPNSAPVGGTNTTSSTFTCPSFGPQFPWNGMMHPNQQQTVTTKVTTTAKLKLELQGLPVRSYSSSNSSNNKESYRRSRSNR